MGHWPHPAGLLCSLAIRRTVVREKWLGMLLNAIICFHVLSVAQEQFEKSKNKSHEVLHIKMNHHDTKQHADLGN